MRSQKNGANSRTSSGSYNNLKSQIQSGNMPHLYSPSDHGSFLDSEGTVSTNIPDNDGTANHAYYSHNSTYITTSETLIDPAWYADNSLTNHITSQLSNLTMKSP